MANRKIIWSHLARIKRYEILEFYIKRNKSKSYSVKLNSKINSATKLLAKQPKLGVKTEIDGIRCLSIDRFKLFYEVSDNHIIIHTIWDTKQNPESLIIK